MRVKLPLVAVLGAILLAAQPLLASAHLPGPHAPMPPGTTLVHPPAGVGETAWNIVSDSPDLATVLGGSGYGDDGLVANGLPADVLSAPFSGIGPSAGFEGIVESKVYINTADGHLLFTYQFFNNSPDQTLLGSANVSGGSLATTAVLNAGELQDGLVFNAGEDPSEYRRGVGTPERLDFFWATSTANHIGNPIPAGGQSTILYIEADAFNWTRGVVGLLDSGKVATTSAFVPAIVPEPLTMLTAGFAVAGLGGYIRKRRKA